MQTRARSHPPAVARRSGSPGKAHWSISVCPERHRHAETCGAHWGRRDAKEANE
jgi:hypothetical protein